MWCAVRTTTIALLLCILLALLDGGIDAEEATTRINVTVYYEALCPDSIEFVTRQLHPAYKTLGKYLDVDFVPYGKATQMYNASSDSWTFRCQHGPAECIGNKIQACGLDQQKQTQDVHVEFINCMMTARERYSYETAKKCSEATGISWNTLASCIRTKRGDNLLAGYGNRTHAADPLITFVPTIVFDGCYNNDIQNESLYDFAQTICDYLDNKPEECKSIHRRMKLFDFASFFN